MTNAGIVIVSHVPELAEGVVRLLKEAAKDVPITFSGGNDDGEIGTSFSVIEAALANNSGDEIYAFYDLGSAKMNLEMVAELSAKNIVIYDTAFIEGAYTAAALLATGAKRSFVEEQLQSLTIK
ncbi:dihydroxyacetone kinase phosphoryl donor subunit DhaM [Brochothrix campestris]|uniref:phosphoenolpyruvate--glycerone phosphotransferase n=1 Tax=Brochothrix campestris FSL F6-1037 TaxID=1265861 RepID=W7D087_9LIST|nr:dihydroxyacetone kinase phosphoryl donor subunit DhaM [Brochothrix campestris]EUJ41366.1 PTS-dependent dihydroxyacetone kinase,phosphotransferase subunit dhaM [Brochothrix campestris FSL F6-1037]